MRLKICRDFYESLRLCQAGDMEVGLRQQCDKIGRFITLWTTIILPKPTTLLGNFFKVVKIFLVKSFLRNFTDIWQLFTGHTVRECNLPN